MKHQNITLFFAAVMLVSLAGAVVFAGPPSSSATFVGSTTCKMCHSDKYSEMYETSHAHMFRPSSEVEFKNDADGNGKSDFEDGLVLDGTHEYDKDLAKFAAAGFTITLGTEATEQGAFSPTMTIGTETFTVDFVWGSIETNYYVHRFGNSNYRMPVSYSVSEGAYHATQQTAWFLTDSEGNYTGLRYADGKTPLTEGRTGDAWQKSCMPCHTTGLTKKPVQNEDGEWLGDPGKEFKEYSIMCEACHGPGSEHVGGANQQEDKKIVNPEELADSQLQTSICARCHFSGSTAAGLSWAWDDANDEPMWPGEDIDDFVTLNMSGYPDGTPNRSHGQYNELTLATHHDNPHNNLNCFDCHDPHEKTEYGHQLKSNYEDNTLCLDCHADHGFANELEISQHTRHPLNPEVGLSRCVNCHMMSAFHTFETVLPEKTLKFKMPNSCMTACHKSATVDGVKYEATGKWDDPADQTIARFLDRTAQTWWGSNLPTAGISTAKIAYSEGESVMLNLGAANPNHRFVRSQLLIIMLTPKGELFFFPTWGTKWASVKATLPNDFELPSTPLIPVVPSSGPGNYYVGFAIVSEDSTLEKLTLYSNFSLESGSIGTFMVQ
ncbi:hypothetical protein KKB18_03050 [bacterium]|nr:hypothetical protein [bacterium]